MNTPALQTKDLYAWHGESHILHGVDLIVNRGEAVTLLGCNGASRTTTLCAIMDLVDTRKGSIVAYDADDQGVETIDLPTHKIAHCGIEYCPEEHSIFSSLSCGRDLMLPPVLKSQAAKIGNTGMSIDKTYEMFPNLAGRRQSRGTRLSGGEQQMLATGRTLRTGVSLLLLDEIPEGLAPVIAQVLAHTILIFKKHGYTVAMVEQNFRFVAPLTGRFHAMGHGRIVERFEAAQLQNKAPILHELLGV